MSTIDAKAFTNLLCLVDLHGPEKARELCLNVHPSESIDIDYLINIANNKLANPVNFDDILNTYEHNPILDECAIRLAEHALYYNIDYLYKVILMVFVTEIDHNNKDVYFLLRNFTKLIISKVTIILDNYNRLQCLNYNTLEDLVTLLSYDELSSLSDKIDELSTREDYLKFSEDCQEQLDKLILTEYTKDIKFVHQGTTITLQADDKAELLSDYSLPQEISFVCRESFRKDREDSVLMLTPPAPRLRTQATVLKNFTVGELVQQIPKAWADKTYNDFFGLLPLKEIRIL